MKILILTLPLHGNYGGVLQAYALQTVLKRMGHEVVTIRKKHKEDKILLKGLRKKINPIWRYFKEEIMKDNEYKRIRLLTEKEKRRKEFCNKSQQNIEDFIINNINIIELYLDQSEEETEFIQTFEAIIVGSDQVWRAQYGNVSTYFLDFAQNLR